MNLILLGAPGGKGHASRGDLRKIEFLPSAPATIIREALKNGTELGQKAKS